MAIATNTSLGFLNKLRASLTFPSFTAGNIIAPNLGPDGVRFTPSGTASVMLDQTTGRVISQNPYIGVSIEVQLIRTQSLCTTWLNRLMSNSAIGDIQVTSDATIFPDLYIENAAITNIGQMPFNGTSANMPLTLEGTWVINTDLWSAA